MKQIFIIQMLMLSGLLCAYEYDVSLSEIITNYDEEKEISGQVKAISEGVFEIQRIEKKENEKSQATETPIAGWSILIKEFIYHYEKSGDIYSLSREQVEKIQSVSGQIQQKNNRIFLFENGVIQTTINDHEIFAEGWEGLGISIGKLYKEQKAEFQDYFPIGTLIQPIPIVFNIEQSVAAGDIIKLPLAKPLEIDHLSSYDYPDQLIVISKADNVVTLASSRTQEAKLFLLQWYVTMDYDLTRQVPIRMVQKRFAKTTASDELTVTMNSELVMEMKE